MARFYYFLLVLGLQLLFGISYTGVKSERQKGYACLPGAEGYFTDADCTPDFYYCHSGVAYPEHCPCQDGFPPEDCPVYDSVVGICVDPAVCTAIRTSTTQQMTTTTTTTTTTTPRTTTTTTTKPTTTTTTTTPSTTTTTSTPSTTTTPTTTTPTTTTTTLPPTTLRPITCTSDGFYPVPASCTSSYYVCTGGVASAMTCPGNTIFDPVTYKCTKYEEASCVKPYECPTQTGSNFYPYSPDACSSLYFLCLNGVALPQYCPNNAVFHPVLLTCVPPGQAPPCTPGQTYTPPPTTTTTTTARPTTLHPYNCPHDGNYPVPESCTSTFYICIGGVAVPEYCPPGVVFDPVTYKCIPSEEASCNQPFECPAQSGTAFYPYSSDACSSLYYTCIEGNAFVGYCPDNTIFLSDVLTCVPIGEEPPCTPGQSYTP